MVIARTYYINRFTYQFTNKFKYLVNQISSIEMSVVSVKVPPGFREKMRAHADSVRWPDEIRRFLQERLEELEREKALSEAIELLESLPTAPRGTARSLVREDRDGH